MKDAQVSKIKEITKNRYSPLCFEKQTVSIFYEKMKSGYIHHCRDEFKTPKQIPCVSIYANYSKNRYIPTTNNSLTASI